MALNRFVALDKDVARAKLYRFLNGKPTPKGQPLKPTRNLVNNVEDALRGVAMLDVEGPPCWIGSGPHPYPAEEIIACANGLLHYPTRTLIPPTPKFFNVNSTTFDFDPDAPRPKAWHAFLESLFGDDKAAVRTLQEFMGITLTTETRYQKILLVIGPKRAGKGTIARVMRALVGNDNVAGPALAALGTQFGLQSLIGKQLAIISDARIGMRADLTSIAENLLRISGEDLISIPRKYLSDWSGRLTVRFMLLSNEVPALSDASGALPSRFVALNLKKSFYGVEDLGLTDRLLRELPGIFLWALDGLDSLKRRGYFEQPDSGADVFRQLEEHASPIKAFIDEHCDLVSHGSVTCATLFERYRDWCVDSNISRVGTIQSFGRALATAIPGLRTSQPRDGDKRVRVFVGIRLRLLKK